MMNLFLRYLTPLTYVMWIVIGFGMIEHFFLEPRGLAILPPAAFDWLLILMWPLLFAIWFGWKEAEKRKAQNSGEPPKPTDIV